MVQELDCVKWVRGIRMHVLFIVKVRINNHNVRTCWVRGLFSTDSPSAYFTGYRRRVPYRRHVVHVDSWTRCHAKYCIHGSSDFLVIAFKPRVKWGFFQEPQCSVLFYTKVTLEELHHLLSLLLLPSHNHVSAMLLFRSSVRLGLGLPPVPRLRDVFQLVWFYFAR